MDKNMTTDEKTNTQSSAILKELSDIKATLAVNTSETMNIKGTIAEIKVNIKEIQADSVSRREFNEASTVLRRDFTGGDTTIRNEFNEAIAPLKKIGYGLVAIIMIGVIGAILNLIILK